MGEKQQNIVLGCLFIILVVTLMALFFSIQISKTGLATQITRSQVRILAYVSIAASDNLTFGIDFGNVSQLPAFLNATQNYNASDQTEYYLSVHPDSNQAADFCMNATHLTTSALDLIGIGNYTWSNSTTNDVNNPTTTDTIPLTEALQKTAFSIQPGDDNYYRFWLNISLQPPGLYNNTVWFIGVPQGDPCT